MKRFNVFLLAALLFICAGAIILLPGCTKNESQTIKIGAILPLTGDLSSYGVDSRKAIEMAVEKLNKSGGINGRRISLVIEDSQGNAKSAVSALNKLITVDKIEGCLGPITSVEVLSVAPIANTNKVVLISPSATSSEISKAGEYIFRTINDDSIETQAMARYVLDQLRIKNIGIIALQASGTLSYANSFEHYFTKGGGMIKSKEIVSDKMREYRSPIKKVLNNKVDAIYISGYSKEIGQIVKEVREVNKSVNLISYQSAEDKRVVEIAGKAVDGLQFSSTTLPASVLGQPNAEFVQEFTSLFGKTPGVFAAEIYDGANILANAIKLSFANKTNLLAELAHTAKYSGASGPITFDNNGDVHKPIAIYKYQQTEPVFISTVGVD